MDLGGGSELCAWVRGVVGVDIVGGEWCVVCVSFLCGTFLFPHGAIALVDTQIDISFDVMFFLSGCRCARF